MPSFKRVEMTEPPWIPVDPMTAMIGDIAGLIG